VRLLVGLSNKRRVSLRNPSQRGEGDAGEPVSGWGEVPGVQGSVPLPSAKLPTGLLGHVQPQCPAGSGSSLWAVMTEVRKHSLYHNVAASTQHNPLRYSSAGGLKNFSKTDAASYTVSA
jgi:hypothetical protein